MEISLLINILLLILSTFGAFMTLLLINMEVAEKGFRPNRLLIFCDGWLNMLDLIRKTTNKRVKRRYWLMVLSLPGFAILFIVTALTCIGDPKERNCRPYRQYLERKIDGKVINKFRNEPDHNMKTLTIQIDSLTIRDVELNLILKGFYDSIKVGDLIKKSSGDSVTYIERAEGVIPFTVSKIDYCGD